MAAILALSVCVAQREDGIELLSLIQANDIEKQRIYIVGWDANNDQKRQIQQIRKKKKKK